MARGKSSNPEGGQFAKGGGRVAAGTHEDKPKVGDHVRGSAYGSKYEGHVTKDWGDGDYTIKRKDGSDLVVHHNTMSSRKSLSDKGLAGEKPASKAAVAKQKEAHKKKQTEEERASAALDKKLQAGVKEKMIPEAKHQFDNDPDKKMIATRGKMRTGQDRDDSLPTMNDGHCHWNASKLYSEGKVDSIVIGYAHMEGTGWFQHTWGMKNGKVVETTPSGRGVRNYSTGPAKVGPGVSRYFGAELTHSEAKKFAAHTAANPPGQGMVRTKRGAIFSGE